MTVQLDSKAEIRGERREHLATQGSGQNGLLMRGIVVLALVAVAGLALWATLMPPKSKATGPEKVVIRQTAQFEAAPVPPQPLMAPVATAVVLPTPPLVAQPAAKDDLLESARRAPVMAFNRQSRASNPNTIGAASLTAYGAGSTGAEDGGTFDKLLKPTVLEGSRAGLIGNRDTLIAMGTSIPCVLETALQSDQLGLATSSHQSRRAVG